MAKQIYAFITLLLFVVSSQATTYWVSPTGNDSNDGLDSTSAWLSIDNGDSEGILAPGDTVNIMPGTYTPSNTIQTTTSGTELQKIVYRKYGNGSAVIDGSSHGNILFKVQGSYVIIDGLELQNGSKAGFEIVADSCRISSCYIHNFGDFGIDVTGNYNLFYRNIIAYATNSGIENDGAYNNTYNNTIFYCDNRGIHYKAGVSNGRIFNNISVGHNEGIRGTPAIVVGFNLTWDNTNDYINGIIDSAGGVTDDPMFVDTASADFRLRYGSPAIDAGIDLGYSFIGSAPDMGAEEYNHIPTNYYVATTGNDSNDGLDSTNAWLSIDNGDSQGILGPGDTINIYPGTYFPSITIVVSTPGTSALPITYRKIGSGDAIIDFGGIFDEIIHLDGNHTHLVGLTFTNSTRDCIEINADSCMVTECIAHDYGYQGVDISGSNNLILRNIFYRAGESAMVNRAGAENNKFYNNTAYSCPYDGVWVDNSVSTARIFNNIIVMVTDGIDANAGNVCGFNNIWNSTSTNYNNGALDSAGSISVDPLFVDTAGGDFSLLSGSPCIDAGLDLGYPYNGSAPDMGAIESDSTANQPPVWSPIADTTVEEGQNLNFMVSASDPDGTTPALTAENLPVNATFTDNGNGSGVFVFNPNYSQAGIDSVTFIASDGALADTEVIAITVTLAPLSYMVIAPDSIIVSADSTQQFTVTGYNAGDVATDPGNITWSVTATIGAIDTSGLFDAVTVGIAQVIAVSDLGPADTNTYLEVTPGNVSYIQTSPATITIPENTTQQFTTNGFDSDSNLAVDLTDSVSWTTSDPTGIITSGGLYTAGTDLSPPVYYITATYNTLSDSSEVTVISDGSLAYIRIELEDGTPLGDTTLSTDNDTTTLYCRGYDSGDSLLGDVSGNWSLISVDGIGTISPNGGVSTTLQLTKPGTGQITATKNPLVDTTGIITCTAGIPAQLIISPDTATVSADSSLQFSFVSYDADGNISGFIPAYTWSVTGGIGSIDSSGLFTPSGAGSGYIIVSGAGLVDTAGPIVVVPGELVAITIIPDTVTVGVNDSVQFQVVGYDAKANTTDPGNIAWSALGHVGDINSSGLFISNYPGVAKVTAVSSIANIADTSGFISIAALYFSTIPLGNSFVYPRQTTTSVLSFRIDNYFDSAFGVTAIKVRDASKGSKSQAERLADIDSVGLYIDTDNDSILTVADSLIAKVVFDADTIQLAFPALLIEPDSGRIFHVSPQVSLFPRDGDTLDFFLVPTTDIQTGNDSTVIGPDTANSLGFSIIDGMIAEQVQLTAIGSTTITPADSVYHVLTVDIPRNGYRADSLQSFSLVNLGTAGENDFDSLVLYADNGNTVWDGVSQETRLGLVTFTGERWTVTGLTAPLTAQTNRFFVGAELSQFPVEGVSVSFGIPSYGIDVMSSNDGPLDMAIPPVDTMVIQTVEAVLVNGKPIPGGELIPGAISGPLMGLEINNSYAGAVAIDSLRFTLVADDPDGATQAQLDSQFDSLLLYINLDDDYTTLGIEDTLIATASVVDGSVLFHTNGLTVPAYGGVRGITITAALNLQNAKNGNLINIALDSSSDIYLSPTATISGAFPIRNGEDFTINSFPAEAVVINNVPGCNLFGGMTDQLVLDMEIPRNGYAVDQLSRLSLYNNGTLQSNNNELEIKLWADIGGDGYTPDDEFIGQFIFDGQLWQLDNISYSLLETSTRFFVTISIINDIIQGGTIQFQIPVGGIEYWSGTMGPDDIAVVNPEMYLVFPANRITAISIPQLSSTISPGSIGNSLLTFALYNGYTEQVKTLRGITFTNISQGASTVADADYELGQVSLYYDDNHDRLLNDDILVATGYAIDNIIQLRGMNISLPSESLSYFFVLTDIPLQIKDGDSLALEVSGASDFVFTDEVSINGDIPLNSGNYIIVDGSIAAQYALLPLTPQTLRPGDSSVTMFVFQPAQNGSATDTLQSIEIKNNLTATSDDIDSLALWLDLNQSGGWDANDSLLGAFTFNVDRWTITNLNLIVNETTKPLLVTGGISQVASPNATIQLQLPIDGCQYQSGNDGPIDEPLTSQTSFTISSSSLRITNTALSETYSVGQTIPISFTVSNASPDPVNGIMGEIVNISNPGIVLLDSSYAGPDTVQANDSTTFTFYYRAVDSGTVNWSVRAVAWDIPDSSATIETNDINIQLLPDNVSVQLINSMPASVIRGQQNIFPLSILIEHPDSTNAVTSLLLDSLLLRVEDNSGQTQYASDIFSRLILSSDYTNITILETIPHDTDIWLRFNQPVTIESGHKKQFILLVDIDSTASANDYVLSLPDETAIPLVNNNSLLPVTLDSSLSFPLKTAVCRIDNPSQQMVVATDNPAVEFANYGQKQLSVLELLLRHPGVTGSSQIQLTDLAFTIVDSIGDTIKAGDVINRISLSRQGAAIGELSETQLDTTAPIIALSSPITLSPGALKTVDIQLSIRNQSMYREFALVIADSSCFTVRDINTGAILATATDTLALSTSSVFPVSTALIQLKQSAQPPELCIVSHLPSSIVGGVDTLPLAEFTLNYPVTLDHSPVSLSGMLVTVLDSSGTPLDPNQLFNRIGYRIGGGTIKYQSQIELSNGATLFRFDSPGINLDPGDSANFELVADIEANVPYNNFQLAISSEDYLLLCDATDTTIAPGVTLSASCSNSFPFVAGPTSIFLPAGRPLVNVQDIPTQIVYTGQQNLSLLTASVTYNSQSQQGSLLLAGLYGQILKRTISGFTPVQDNPPFDNLTLSIDSKKIAVDSSITGDSISFILQSPYNIPHGSQKYLSITGAVRPEAQPGNYVIVFTDSSFLKLSDEYLGTTIYPALQSVSYPFYSTEINIEEPELENSFSNYPNPFVASRNEQTTIGYVLPEDAYVDLEIFSITGKLIKTIVSNALKTAGAHQEDSWAGYNDAGGEVVTGTYFCRITAKYISGKTESYKRKVAVIR